MPVSVYKNALANVPTPRHINNGMHYYDIFANEDGGPHMTSGVSSVTKHASGGTTLKAPCITHIIVMEGEVTIVDVDKPGENSVLGPGDVLRVDKGTTSTMSSPSAGKVFFVAQREFGMDLKKITV